MSQYPSYEIDTVDYPHYLLRRKDKSGQYILVTPEQFLAGYWGHPGSMAAAESMYMMQPLFRKRSEAELSELNRYARHASAMYRTSLVLYSPFCYMNFKLHLGTGEESFTTRDGEPCSEEEVNQIMRLHQPYSTLEDLYPRKQSMYRAGAIYL